MMSEHPYKDAHDTRLDIAERWHGRTKQFVDRVFARVFAQFHWGDARAGAPSPAPSHSEMWRAGNGDTMQAMGAGANRKPNVDRAPHEEAGIPRSPDAAAQARFAARLERVCSGEDNEALAKSLEEVAEQLKGPADKARLARRVVMAGAQQLRLMTFAERHRLYVWWVLFRAAFGLWGLFALLATAALLYERMR